MCVYVCVCEREGERERARTVCVFDWLLSRKNDEHNVLLYMQLFLCALLSIIFRHLRAVLAESTTSVDVLRLR